MAQNDSAAAPPDVSESSQSLASSGSSASSESASDDFSFVTSYVFPPLVLGSIRLLVGLYCLSTLIADLVLNATLKRIAEGYFSYFTHLSMVGICAYYIAAAVQTLWFHSRNQESCPLLDSWPRPFLILHSILASTIMTYPLLTTIVYWALLSHPTSLSTPYLAWSNISVHALNTVFALFEVVFTNLRPMPWMHLVSCIIILAGYLGVAYLTFATQGFYPYRFLDPSDGPILAAYIIGIAVAEIIVFVVIRLIAMLRVRLVEGPPLRVRPIDQDEEKQEGSQGHNTVPNEKAQSEQS